MARTLHVTIALGGTAPVAMMASALIARRFPIAQEDAFALGFALFLPLWVTAMCMAFLAKGGLRAFVGCVVASVLLGAALYG